MSDHPQHRDVPVPDVVAGMRLDRFLALRFRDRSRSEFARAIRAGEVRDAEDRPLRASTKLRGGETLRVYMEGIAPDRPPPPFPAVLYEDDLVAVIDKPPGLMAHPSGTRYVYALIGLAKDHWPDHRVDLVHRLDKDTSGVMLLTKDLEANRWIKARMKAGEHDKVYLALCRGRPTWEERIVDAPIGSAGGEIRIQMAVRDGGLPSRTDVQVEARHPEAEVSLVRCRLHTGRTHQIRVHMHHLGHPLLGDLLYGVPPSVFLDVQDHGVTEATLAAVSTRRHALHAHRLTFPHPELGSVTVESPLPPDMASWWADPASLPGMGREG